MTKSASCNHTPVLSCPMIFPISIIQDLEYTDYNICLQGSMLLHWYWCNLASKEGNCAL